MVRAPLEHEHGGQYSLGPEPVQGFLAKLSGIGVFGCTLPQHSCWRPPFCLRNAKSVLRCILRGVNLVVLVRCSLPQERILRLSSVGRCSREQRRALKKLAGTPRGLTEHLLLAHGFSVEMLSGLVHAQLATVVTEAMMARRGVTIMVERIRITDAGRMALEGRPPAGALGISRASVHRVL